MPITLGELNGPDVLGAALKERDITPDRLAAKLDEELGACVIKVFCNKDGELTYSKKLIDWRTRQAARQDAQKLLDLYPSEKHEHSLSSKVLGDLFNNLPEAVVMALCAVLDIKNTPKVEGKY